MSIDGVEMANFELNALFLPLMQGSDWLRHLNLRRLMRDKGENFRMQVILKMATDRRLCVNCVDEQVASCASFLSDLTYQ